MFIRTGAVVAALATAFVLAVAVAQEKPPGEKKLRADLAVLEKLTLEDSGKVEGQRAKIAAHGPSALPVVMEQLGHRDARVRRGAALICYWILEKEDLPDVDLMERFLEIITNEKDQKCRATLTAVVRLLVDDLCALARDGWKKPPTGQRAVAELEKPVRFDVKGKEGKLYAEIRTTKIEEPDKVHCSVRLVRKDGTEAGVGGKNPEFVSAGKQGHFFFRDVRVEQKEAAYPGVGVDIVAYVVDESRVALRVETQVYI
jgi:hypothetical protein